MALISTQFTIDSTDPVMKDVDASQIERKLPPDYCLRTISMWRLWLC